MPGRASVHHQPAACGLTREGCSPVSPYPACRVRTRGSGSLKCRGVCLRGAISVRIPPTGRTDAPAGFPVGKVGVVRIAPAGFRPAAKPARVSLAVFLTDRMRAPPAKSSSKSYRRLSVTARTIPVTDRFLDCLLRLVSPCNEHGPIGYTGPGLCRCHAPPGDFISTRRGGAPPRTGVVFAPAMFGGNDHGMVVHRSTVPPGTDRASDAKRVVEWHC